MSADDDEVRITLRMPSRLRNDLASAASNSGRSMNGEIVARLEGTLRTRESQQSTEVRDLLEKYHRATEAENYALKRGVVGLEALLFQFGASLRKAAAGDRAALNALVDLEREEAFLSKVLSHSPAFEDRE